MSNLYQAVDLYWVALKSGLVAFWPVMRRPGRQRVTRRAFDHPSDAAVYGLRLQNRYQGFVFWALLPRFGGASAETVADLMMRDVLIAEVCRAYGISPSLLLGQK